MAEVRLEGITKRHGTTVAIDALSLTVREGEFFVLVGPSGCGKSTLLHLLAGLDSPSAGSISFDGQDVTAVPPGERDVALVFQSYALYPHLTAAENLAFPLRVRKRKLMLTNSMIDQEVSRVAEMLGLNACLDRKPSDLSGGQRQRVALGRALIRKPRVFLMDEPLSNLDAQLRASMRGELRRLHEKLKITTIYVTHDQTEAMTLGDRLAVLDQGRVQQVGQPQEIYARPANLFVAGFLGYPPMNLLQARVEGDLLAVGPIRLAGPHEAPALKDRQTVAMGIRPEEIRVGSPEEPGGKGSGAGIIRLIEPSGTAVWVTVDFQDQNGSTTVIGTAVSGFAPKIGHSASVSFGRATLHLFDSSTGQRFGSA
jgi:multiple sugar transport system ATP-binding protein